MIEINNLSSIRLDKKFIKKVGQKVLAGEKKNIGLSIAFVSSKTIREANKIYRHKDKTTDVLSFPEPKKTPLLKGFSTMGQIIICPSLVKKNAKRFKVSFKKELSRILTHGILHLLGYDHERSRKGKSEMEKKENYYSAKFNY